jgi:hypothetical protein
VDLAGVGIWDAALLAGTAPTTNRFFAEGVLGPGELMVVFADGGGVFTNAAPWCAALQASDGDAVALGTPLALNNDGDTLRLTVTNARDAAAIDTFVWGAGILDQSVVRDPPESVTVVPYTTARGARGDRRASPSTSTDGSNQAAFAAP